MNSIDKQEVNHLEIAEYLIQMIRNGTYAVGEKIPSEHMLCGQFNVARHVARQAIGRITNLGWVTPVQGKGCYVNEIPKTIPYVLSSRTRFSENMDSQGVQHKGKLIDWKKNYPTEREQEQLQLTASEKIYRLEIVRYINDQAISVTTTSLPMDEFPYFNRYLQDFDSLYRILLDHYHLRPIRSKSMFQAILPLLKDAALLEIPESIPIIQMESIMNHPNGTPIEYSISRIRGDMQQYVVEF
ncbi:GntR family transcriptional regulator [Aquibacillus albus]|uniref:DNA-binding GntR family transcriptional regulator n=1 Tax=Aquibacillus albus TaxID=1168171 RepID=A0ABS2N5A5_9BACI|nr:GntR family transcriptional regulator [Aquibacillus albus]MBM7573302.1 DNA-binding GntR family transcriptional regulator [Aquibacillus albus]